MDRAADESIMLEVRDGQVVRLSELFERHHRGLFNFFYRLTGSRTASEDLVQEVFLRLLKYRHTYSPKTSFTAWLFQVARNTHFDSLRSSKPESQWHEELPEPASADLPNDERLDREQQAYLVRRAMLSLPDDKRELLVMSRYQNLRYDEIGRILGCEVGTVKTRVFRAVRALGEAFAELAGERAS
jgi:RNA polymerase sigma-70 factor (ECF subfamily)